jgi:hypothetical protein
MAPFAGLSLGPIPAVPEDRGEGAGPVEVRGAIEAVRSKLVVSSQADLQFCYCKTPFSTRYRAYQKLR